jgi:hypothetical protein
MTVIEKNLKYGYVLIAAFSRLGRSQRGPQWSA